MKDKKQDYRKDPGFFSNIWDKTKAALKGSATPVKYTAAAAAGMWLGGTLLNFGLFENFIGNNNLGSLVQDAFWGNQLELVPFFSKFSFLPVGVIPSTIIGITALCSIPKAIKNYREYKHQHQKSAGKSYPARRFLAISSARRSFSSSSKASNNFSCLHIISECERSSP